MSDHRTVVTARWPFTPLGTKISVEVPESYELEGVGSVVNELVAELRKESLLGRFFRTLFAPVISIKATFTRG